MSVHISAGNNTTFTDVWVHFDAKYRVESVNEIVGEDERNDEAEPTDQDSSEFGAAKRSDLLKMHTYRDAIRRSAGAYVLYPGDTPKQFREYHEILPGLGAFGLRPTSRQGVAQGEDVVRTFLDHVLSHTASQATQHERVRFWTARGVAGSPPRPALNAPFLDSPPADTTVLLGYVRSSPHLEWIHRTGLYNLRAGDRSGSVGVNSRELACDLLMLYGQVDQPELWQLTGEPVLMSRSRLVEMEYPDPRGDLYFCLPLDSLPSLGRSYGISDDVVQWIAEQERGSRPRFSPVAVTWLRLLEAANVATGISR
jgi:PD-(D/E)XK nuclease superfamily